MFPHTLRICCIVDGGCTLPDGTPEHGPARVARQ